MPQSLQLTDNFYKVEMSPCKLKEERSLLRGWGDLRKIREDTKGKGERETNPDYYLKAVILLNGAWGPGVCEK